MPEQLTDAYSDLPVDQAAAPGSPAAAKPLSFLERVKLGTARGAAGPDWGLNQMTWRNRAMSEVSDALTKRGITPVSPLSVTSVPFVRGESAPDHYERAWRLLFEQVAKVREADPKFLPDYASVTDRESFEHLVEQRRTNRLGEIDRDAPDGLGVAGFIGAIGHGLTDPTSYIPVGGQAKNVGLSFGQALLRTAAREGVANVAFTAATEPLVRRDAARMGVDRTISDTLTDLGIAGVTGAAIGGTFEAAARAPRAIGERLFPDVVRQFDADAFGKALHAHIEATDPSPFGTVDVGIARAFGAAVPADKRTPEENAAIAATERDAEVKATSPFVANPIGDDEHFKWLDAALHFATDEDAPPIGRAPQKPVAREDLAAGTADPSSLRAPARATLKAKIHHAEAPNGGANALGSGALGPYQFMPRTWVSLFKKRYPGDSRSFDQIAALRTDPHLNEVLIDDLINENSTALRHAGLPETAGNLYLAHVLGHDRAIYVLKAGADVPLAKLLPNDYFGKNPFKGDWTAGRLTEWAYARMGDKGLPEHVAATATPESSARAAEDAAFPIADHAGRNDVEALLGIAADDRPILKPELFDSPEAHAAAQRDWEAWRDASEGYAVVKSRDELFEPAAHEGALRRYQGPVNEEVMAEALGIRPGQLRQVVGAMQALDPNSPYMLTKGRQPKYDKLGNLTKEGTEPGRVIRRPMPIDRGPESLVAFLKRKGGISAAHGSDLIAMDAPASLVDRRLHDARQAARNAAHSKAPRGLREHRIAEADRRLSAVEREIAANPRGMALDDAFELAIEAGYFPRHQIDPDRYDKLPDTQELLDAIHAELHGKPHYAPDAHDELAQRMRDQYGEEPPPEGVAAGEFYPGVPGDEAVRLFNVSRDLGLRLDDETLIHAAELKREGLSDDDALIEAMDAEAARYLEDTAGELGYGFDNDGRRFSEALHDDGLPEVRDTGADGGAAAAGVGRSSPDAGGTAGSRAALAQSAHDPALREFDDPVGPAAEAQADNIVHDAEMAAEAGADARTYRLSDEGEESDLKAILDEIEAAQKAAAELRACMKPKGGGE